MLKTPQNKCPLCYAVQKLNNRTERQQSVKKIPNKWNCHIHAQRKILLPFRGSFHNFQRSHSITFIRERVLLSQVCIMFLVISFISRHSSINCRIALLVVLLSTYMHISRVVLSKQGNLLTSNTITFLTSPYFSHSAFMSSRNSVIKIGFFCRGKRYHDVIKLLETFIKWLENLDQSQSLVIPRMM